MPAKQIAKILKKAAPIPAQEIPRLFELLLACQRESETTARKTKKYDAIKEVMIREITGKYGFYEFFFNRIFAERREAIKKDFEVIDQGMRENNRDLVSLGISGLSRLAASSPFADLDNLRKMLE
jgi:hypothetical protein